MYKRQVVQPADVIASMNNGGDSTTDPMKLNNVGSSIADKAGNTYLDKIDAAAADNKTKNGAVNAVSYTHLDVYKRQVYHRQSHNIALYPYDYRWQGL